MSLNRAQKRNLALLLVARAKGVVADWENVSSKSYREIEDGGLKGISQEDVREVYAQWLGYLPNHAWDKVEEPQSASAGPETRGDTTLDGDGSATTNSGVEAAAPSHGVHDTDISYSGTPVVDEDPEAVDNGISDHENVAVSSETPVMGDNDIHHENEVLHSQPVEDDDPTGDKQVVEQSAAGDPQPFQYR